MPTHRGKAVFHIIKAAYRPLKAQNQGVKVITHHPKVDSKRALITSIRLRLLTNTLSTDIVQISIKTIFATRKF